jgi:hypothetical protein
MAPLIPNFGTRWSWMDNFKPRALCFRERTPLPTEQKAVWAPHPVGIFSRRRKSLSATGIGSPFHPVRNLVSISTMSSRLVYVLLNTFSPRSYNNPLNAGNSIAVRMRVCEARSESHNPILTRHSAHDRSCMLHLIRRPSTICWGQNISLPRVTWSVEISNSTRK